MTSEIHKKLQALEARNTALQQRVAQLESDAYRLSGNRFGIVGGHINFELMVDTLFGDQAPGYAFIKDCNMRYLACSRRFAALFGKEPTDVIGRTDEQFLSTDMAQALHREDHEVLTSGQPIFGRRIRSDGLNDLEFLVAKFPVRNADGTISALLGLLWSISEAYDKPILGMLEDREHINRAERLAAIGAMVSMMTHELNQPLTVIQLRLQHIQYMMTHNQLDPDVLSEDVAESLNEVTRAAQTIRHVRGQTRPRHRVPVDDVNAAAVARKITQSLESQAYRNGLTITLKDMTDLPPLPGKPGDLDQIFFVLIENAIQAAPKRPHCSLCISAAYDDETITFSFEDTCGGIPAENLNRIMSLFSPPSLKRSAPDWDFMWPNDSLATGQASSM